MKKIISSILLTTLFIVSLFIIIKTSYNLYLINESISYIFGFISTISIIITYIALMFEINSEIYLPDNYIDEIIKSFKNQTKNIHPDSTNILILEKEIQRLRGIEFLYHKQNAINSTSE